MDATFFPTPDGFRDWLAEHHDTVAELLVGLYKRGSGTASITWPESVDEALCYGWIDGVRRNRDEESYTIRFTPRRTRSTWSKVNIAKFAELERQGRMTDSGRRAFEARAGERSGIYSYEQGMAKFEPEHEKALRANEPAWRFFQSQAPWYQRAATWWVISAKREETRARRLATLIEESAAGRTIGPLTRPGGGRRARGAS